MNIVQFFGSKRIHHNKKDPDFKFGLLDLFLVTSTKEHQRSSKMDAQRSPMRGSVVGEGAYDERNSRVDEEERTREASL